MKKLISLSFVAFLAAQAQATEQVKCGATLTPEVQTYAVEAQHVVDLCTPNGEVISAVKIGNATMWHHKVDSKRGEINLLPVDAGSLTNMIVTATAPDGVEKRYEVRLVSIEPEQRTGLRLPNKQASL